jgi:hypothetical protein
MAELTVQEIGLLDGGLNPSLAAADAGGDEFDNTIDERTFLRLANASAGALSVDVQPAIAELTAAGYGTIPVPPLEGVIPAGEERWFGPFPRAYNDESRKVQITYPLGVTSLTVAVVKLPKG